MRVRLAEAIAASAVLVFASPYVGQVRAAIQAALPGQYRLIIGGMIATGIGAALIHALITIRERRLLRYGLIAAGIAGGTIYAVLSATGNPLVDVVERFHFVEYGFVTLLFYRAWHERANLTALVFPLLAGAMVGTADESMQWLVPARVGEWHDVLLDLAAVGCGLVFSIGVRPPQSMTVALDRSTRRELATFVTTCIVMAAGFFHVVHLGYEVDGGNAGRFLSRFTASQLTEASRDRAVRWHDSPPTVLHRLSIEDQYLAEGLWHIQRRNEGVGLHTWKENLILERFFDPVLRFPTYATPKGGRWPPDQRANVEARELVHDGPYVSDANPYPIYTWSPVVFWIAVSGLIAAVVFVIVKAGATP